MCKEKFNEMDFVKREYELLRFISSTEQFSIKEFQKIEEIQKEIISNEEYMKYAIIITEDRFKVKHFNGIVTVACIIMGLEKINPEIAEQLMENLFFAYQDKEKNVPMALAGIKVLDASYLVHLLVNKEYKIDKKYHSAITKCVMQIAQKESDSALLGLYFVRDDIPIECKKLVIDSLDEDVLYRVTKEWEESFNAFLEESLEFDSLDFMDDESDKFDYDLEDDDEDFGNLISEVIELINEKLYS